VNGFAIEIYIRLALHSLCHRPTALHLLLVGDVTVESPEGKSGSKQLGTETAN